MRPNRRGQRFRGAIGVARVVASFVVVAVAGLASPQSAPSAAAGGTIRGQVHLMGKLPGNPVIRMGMDPKCAQMNGGKLTVQETVMATLDGGLGNVFVSLQGTFPQTAIPSEPVSIDQRACVYRPRVLGVRAGQMLQIRNDDDVLHNLHASSARGNSFNVSQPKAGVVQRFRLKGEEIMVHVSCDVHSWMNAFVGVVNHPYFAVSGPAGAFEIPNVPDGTYQINAWHERYGLLTRTIRVRAGAVANVAFSYTGVEKPSAGIRELVIPGDSPVAELLLTTGR